jgi:uncharacterized membrane-anchored protein YhcB (DUF1043 family)
MTAFWIYISIAVALVIGMAVLVGVVIARRRTGRRPSRAEQMNALKSSGAFPHRKENRP